MLSGIGRRSTSPPGHPHIAASALSNLLIFANSRLLERKIST
jgi:hypothetical protein